MIDYLSDHGTIEVSRVYDSPFTSVAPEGPEAIYVDDDLDEFFDDRQSLPRNRNRLKPLARY